jgi:hypothetical protein
VDLDKLDTTTKLCILVESALAVGAHEARPVTDAEGNPATLTECGSVLLLRILNEEKRGHDRIDVFLSDDDDDEVRLGSKDRLFTLQEHGPHAPELEIINRDVNAWLPIALLALASKISPDGEVAGHA